MKYLILFLVFFAMGCTECKSGTLRCNKNVVQVCNGRGRWSKSRDCDTIKNSTCGVYDGITTCVIDKEKK